MGNTEPNVRDQNHAFKIAGTATDNNDGQLCRQKLEFFLTAALTGKRLGTPQTGEGICNQEINVYNKFQKQAQNEGHTQQDIRAIESEANSVEPPAQKDGLHPQARSEVGQANPTAEERRVTPKPAILQKRDQKLKFLKVRSRSVAIKKIGGINALVCLWWY